MQLIHWPALLGDFLQVIPYIVLQHFINIEFSEKTNKF